MNNITYDISSFNELSSVALKLLRLTDNRIFALYGKIGAGKTTLVKNMCSHLNVIDTVSSPTFSIVNEYMTRDNKQIFHFDFYRINNLEEIEKLGLDFYLSSGSYCFIEWPEIAVPLLPFGYKSLKIIQNNQSRELLLLK